VAVEDLRAVAVVVVAVVVGRHAIFLSAFVVTISFLLWFFQFAISYSHDWEYPYKISEYGLVIFVVDHYINVNGRVPIHLAISLLGDHYSFWKFLHAVMLCVFPFTRIKII